MKKLLLFVALVGMSFYVVGQSFSLSDANGPIEPNSIVYIIGDPTPGVPLTAHIYVTNNSGETKKVMVKKVIQEGDTIPGTINYFCWGVCYGPGTYVSDTVSIEAGGTNEEFTGDYDVDEGGPGKSYVTYVWFDKNNPDDSVAVKVEYNASPAGIGEVHLSKAVLSNAYPNPANTQVSFDYELPEGVYDASILVTNILGVTVKSVDLQSSSGKITIPTFDFPQGIYFYNFIAGNKIIDTRKFIVKH